MRLALVAIAAALLPGGVAGADRACREPSPKLVERSKARAAAKTVRSFEAALRARGLQKLPLGGGRIQLHRGIRGGPVSPGNPKAIPFDKPTATSIDGRSGVFIGGPTFWSGSARTPEMWEFVQNARGEVFRLIRAPQWTERRFDACGCAPRACGPYGSGCPACGVTEQTVYGPLPAGAVYRGEITVRYPAYRIAFDRRPPRGCVQRRCPAGPPRMRGR